MPIPSTNISLVAIQAETGYSSTSNISLTTQSQNAIEGLSTLNEAPYAMSEFSGYTHAIDYPAFVASNVELASAAGYSLTGTKSATAALVSTIGNKVGLNFRVFTNSFGVFLYVRETNGGATSYYYTPANVQTVLSTTDVLASRDNGNINTLMVTEAKIDLVYSTVTSGQNSNSFTTTVNDNVYTAIANGGSVNTSIEIAAGAECFNSVSRRVYGTANVYLRGPGYNDTLVVSHDFDLYCSATATACN
jgi:hypothetical protein